jgi:predicted ribosome quality control (RQC) complex YloA/Tae2 family protein
MDRYTTKSKIKKIKITRNSRDEILFAEYVREPSKVLTEDKKKKLLSEAGVLVKKAWGEYSEENIINGVLHAYFLCLVQNKDGDLVCFAPLKKYRIDKREVYSFSLTATSPEYQKMGIMKSVDFHLGKKVLLENLFRGKFKIEFLFITPNIRTLGTIARVADFIYPNPYNINPETHRVEEADEETWKTVREFLEKAGESYRSLEREGCIMEGFYDDKPQLLYKVKPSHLDKALNDFGDHYLYKKQGRDVIVRAIVGIGGLFRGL